MPNLEGVRRASFSIETYNDHNCAVCESAAVGDSDIDLTAQVAAFFAKGYWSGAGQRTNKAS